MGALTAAGSEAEQSGCHEERTYASHTRALTDLPGLDNFRGLS